ncbi:hypothetical protein L202_01367 [Cryptococcus amylolentus CBS 6039]|uniref:Uncharacterized protein n=1 Tax=Cryptococcus amylolentus CBS 6039 TaxID=1295533 RepID=A0A1E3I5S0_9TREE|nr:hypothetical protein L202_01367 [Cryptococcus amylolentus CBS 6039]ODN83176.1 hypothetical protein L202_01367 [Cryptococcus amylolentus CBS 6039]
MSLHRFFAPPPLALAIHPAPTPKPRGVSDKDKKEKLNPEVKEKEAAPPQKGENVDANHGEGEKKEKLNEETPHTPVSDQPEPPIPAPGALEVPEKEDEKKKEESATQAVKPEEAKHDKVPKTPSVEEKEEKSNKDDDKPHGPDDKDSEEPEPVEPLILLSPAPERPLRTRLDLPPSMVYPPVYSDPRGAYYKYAKAIGNAPCWIDITKDGWLAPQWKERTEREALKRLTGEWEKELQRQIESEKKKTIKRKVPSSSEGLLLDLWNDLVVEDNHELSVKVFWDRYDWDSPEAVKHLSTDLTRPEKPAEEKQDGEDGDAEARPKAKKAVIEKPEVDWTKAGIDDVLSTVGIQCAYNTERSPSRHWSEPAAAFLILAHGHFLIRLDHALTWKPIEHINKGFEVLVTSANDRVFGNMVKAQQAEDRKRREKEYRARKEKEYRERKAREKAEQEKTEKEGEKDKETDETPGTPKSDVQLRDGKPAEVRDVPEESDGGQAIIAVAVNPLPGTGEDKESPEKLAANKDARHDPDPELVPGPKPAEDKVEGDKASPKPGLNDINKAMKALDAAQKADNVASPAAPKPTASTGKPPAKKETGPVFWQWAEKVEKWRWKNFEAGCHVVAPGGWEERDWVEFADGRAWLDWEAEQEEIEKEEIDVHDWSL